MTNMTGTFNNTHLFCACHEKPTEMILHDGSQYAAFNGSTGSVFFSCPRYYEENREEGEKPCFNRLSLTEYELLIEDLAKELKKYDDSQINLTGFRYKNKKGTQFHVLKHGPDGIDISVLNTRALAKK